MDKRSTIVVFGGSGLVGRSLIDRLVKEGYENVIATYHRRGPSHKGARWYELDLSYQKRCDSFFESIRPEYVFLTAAKVGGIVANDKYRADFIYQNLQIQNNVIYNAYKYGAKKLLFFGSTCIYPKNCPQPIKEEYLLTGELEYTNEPYALAKLAGMNMCESFNLQYGTNFINVTPTNVYGPYDNFDLETSHVLPALIRKIHLAKALQKRDFVAIRRDLKANPIINLHADMTDTQIVEALKKYGIDDGVVTVWGSGNPMREFIHSEDLADAAIFLMNRVDFRDIARDIHPIRKTHINIGTSKEIAIKDLAILIKRVVGFDGDFRFDTSKPDGTMRKVTDTSRLKRFGWRHTIELEEGIERVYRWYKEHR